MRILLRSSALLALVWLGSCVSASNEPVTYYEDVRPILAERCTRCHEAGGIAPFALTSYDNAALYGPAVVQATSARVMPPFLADNSGACGHFATDRWLSDEELSTLDRWASGGFLEGDPMTPAPPSTPLASLEVVSTTLDMGLDYLPEQTTSDDYRCFVVEPSWTTDQFVTAYQVHPGNGAIVHHLIVYRPTTDEAAATARAMHATGDPGYGCLGGPGVAAAPLVLWAPGSAAEHYPAGTGLRVEATRPLIIQMHYNIIGDPGGTDRTRVDLTLAPTVDFEGFVSPLVDSDLNLPPGMQEVVEQSDHPLSDRINRSYRVHGLFPHMHQLGSWLRLSRLGLFGEECFIDVPRWDFHWQLPYFYETPRTVLPSDILRLRCAYNTTSRTEVTTWGDGGSTDEMCLVYLYVTR